MEPTSVLRLSAASCAVLAEVSKAITSNFSSKAFSALATRWTGSFANKFSIILLSLVNHKKKQYQFLRSVVYAFSKFY